MSAYPVSYRYREAGLTGSTVSFSDVRCSKCQKLLVKWMRSGRAILDVKCSRCGHPDVVHLST